MELAEYTEKLNKLFSKFEQQKVDAAKAWQLEIEAKFPNLYLRNNPSHLKASKALYLNKKPQ